MKSLQDTLALPNGCAMPCIGFGTWQVPDGDVAVNAVKKALAAGYRHIDTAAIYQNEKSVGKAVAESGIDRASLFITSKVWNSARGYEKTKKAFAQSLADLRTDYLDLYLIHWPAPQKFYPTDWEKINRDTWRALVELHKEGRIKAIGVSNFLVHHLGALMDADVMPMVNQFEFHPGQMQAEVFGFCKQHGILVEAWGPLGTGKMLPSTELAGLASKYGKSVAQLCIRWCLQNGTVPLPKSVNPVRIEENANVFDFSISDGDMAAINAMPYFGGSGLDPDEVDF